MSFLIDKNQKDFIKGAILGGESVKKILTQSVTQGDTTHAPSGDAVFTAIANAITTAGTAQTGWDASSGTYPTIDKNGDPIKALDYWTISVQGILNGETAYIGDILYSAIDNPGQDPTKWFVIRNSNGIISDSYLYVDIAKGNDTNQGTILNPFKTISYAISQISTNGGTVFITQNNSIASETISVNAINNYIVLCGSSASEKTIIDKLYITATTGVVYLSNISVNEIKASCNVILDNVIINTSAEYTANNTLIVYQGVNYSSASHTFIHNGTLTGNFTELAECRGNIISLPLILEDVISASTLTPPALVNLTIGDRYLINGTGSGDWVGHDFEIASWDGSNWIYETLVDENIVTTQDTIPLSYIYRIGTGSWQRISKWGISTRTADTISAGLMSTNDYEKLLYSSTATNVLASNNILEEKLTLVGSLYTFTSQPKFSHIIIKPEDNLAVPQTNVNTIEDFILLTNLASGNILVTLPDLENVTNKSSFGYDGDKFQIQLASNKTAVQKIVINAPNNRNIINSTGAVIDNLNGLIVSAGVSITFRWSDNNPNPAFRLKPVQWEVL